MECGSALGLDWLGFVSALINMLQTWEFHSVLPISEHGTYTQTNNRDTNHNLYAAQTFEPRRKTPNTNVHGKSYFSLSHSISLGDFFSPFSISAVLFGAGFYHNGSVVFAV